MSWQQGECVDVWLACMACDNGNGNGRFRGRVAWVEGSKRVIVFLSRPPCRHRGFYQHAMPHEVRPVPAVDQLAELL